jgi:hypothetical protein
VSLQEKVDAIKLLDAELEQVRTHYEDSEHRCTQLVGDMGVIVDRHKQMMSDAEKEINDGEFLFVIVVIDQLINLLSRSCYYSRIACKKQTR